MPSAPRRSSLAVVGAAVGTAAGAVLSARLSGGLLVAPGAVHRGRVTQTRRRAGRGGGGSVRGRGVGGGGRLLGSRLVGEQRGEGRPDDPPERPLGSAPVQDGDLELLGGQLP